MTTKALGKGLSALIGDTLNNNIESNQKNITLLPLENLFPGKFQPRSNFNEKKINELAESIKENGVLQPILVRKIDNDKYQIIAGERRWRASMLCRNKTIPVIIKNNINEQEALEIALVENIQRENLSPIEEAEAYKKLKNLLACTQEELAYKLGKSRSHVTNTLRILSLPENIKDLINSESITMGHARALINSENPYQIANVIIEKNLNVREAEELVAQSKQNTKKTVTQTRSKKTNKNPDVIDLENSISSQLGLPVIIEENKNYGNVKIVFTSLAELDSIIKKLVS